MKQKLAPLFGATALAALTCAAPAHAQSNEAELAAEVKQLRAEMQQMRQELQALKNAQKPATAAAAPVPAAATASAPGAAPASSTASATPPVTSPAPATAAATTSTPAWSTAAAPAPAGGTGLTLFGYGEIGYARPSRDPAGTTATLTRGVLGWGYHFDDRTRMAAELEVENAVASSSDKGEVEIEQMYVERDFRPDLTGKAGLFLMPVGLLNESHEPPRYYGVFRNQVETAIIPTTWRELGLGLQGRTQDGLRWDAGVVTSFDLTKWDPTSESEGRASPLGSIHQEGQLALARSLAGYGALNYSGIPGLDLGGSVFHGGVGQHQPNFPAPNASYTLAEAHVRWQPGRWDVAALAAQGRFSGVSELNATTFAGQPTPVPDRFGGWYVQAAYKAWSSGEQSLSPFARYERLNTAESYSGIPQGLASPVQPDTRTLTVGANYYLTPQVVMKMDYMRFFNDGTRDRLDLGVGFEF